MEFKIRILSGADLAEIPKGSSRVEKKYRALRGKLLRERKANTSSSIQPIAITSRTLRVTYDPAKNQYK